MFRGWGKHVLIEAIFGQAWAHKDRVSSGLSGNRPGGGSVQSLVVCYAEAQCPFYRCSECQQGRLLQGINFFFQTCRSLSYWDNLHLILIYVNYCFEKACQRSVKCTWFGSKIMIRKAQLATLGCNVFWVLHGLAVHRPAPTAWLSKS